MNTSEEVANRILFCFDDAKYKIGRILDINGASYLRSEKLFCKIPTILSFKSSEY